MKGAASIKTVEDSQTDNEFTPTVVEAKLPESEPEPEQKVEAEVKTQEQELKPTKTKKSDKLTNEVIEQSDRIMNALTSDIDESLREEIKNICLQDEFTIDGYKLKWNRLSKNLIKRVDEVITFKTMPGNITEPEEKQDWMLRNYFKLVFQDFTDDMYYDMSIPALKVLEQAPHARIKGLFRRR